MREDRQQTRSSSFSPKMKLALAGFIAIAAFYLITEHRAHLFGVLPYLLILLCPLLHFFMHGRHGEHGEHGAGHSGATEKTENRER